MPARIVTAVPRLTPTTTQGLMVPANGAGVTGSAIAEGMPEIVIDVSGNGVEVVFPVMVVLGVTISLGNDVLVRAGPGNGIGVLALAIAGFCEVVPDNMALMKAAVDCGSEPLCCPEADERIATLAVVVAWLFPSPGLLPAIWAPTFDGDISLDATDAWVVIDDTPDVAVSLIMALVDSNDVSVRCPVPVIALLELTMLLDNVVWPGDTALVLAVVVSDSVVVSCGEV